MGWQQEGQREETDHTDTWKQGCGKLGSCGKGTQQNSQVYGVRHWTDDCGLEHLAFEMLIDRMGFTYTS